MRQFIIDQLMTLDVIDESKVIEYVDFCLKCIPKTSSTQNHHILPVAVFSQFESFAKNNWNCAVLDNDDHYIAHALLHEAINNYSFASAWYGMNNKNYFNGEPLKILGAEKYNELIIKRNKQCSERQNGIVMAKTIDTGEIIRVTKEEFNSNDNLVGATIGKSVEHLKGTVSVFGEDGKPKRIKSEDFDPLIHTGITKGKTMYKDKDGNRFQTNKDDPRVISGELVGIMKGCRFKNSNAIGQYINIHIYNELGEVMFECYGNFKKTCELHDIPLKYLSATIKNNSVINVHIRSAKYIKYNGWYARKINK